MIGAIIGDICGSAYEFNPVTNYDFPLFTEESQFTDDTVLTMAVAEALLQGNSFAFYIREYVKDFPNRGYGDMFSRWIFSENMEAYNSFGNGSAMRVSPVGFLSTSVDETLDLAKKSAEVTHNHPEGIKGAQATALAIFLAKSGKTKGEIKWEIEERFNYDLSRSLKEIEQNYYFNETCQESVPEAITAFLESTDYESAIRNAIWLKGDADTLACITGGIAEAFYGGVPEDILNKAKPFFPKGLRGIYHRFQNKIEERKLLKLYRDVKSTHSQEDIEKFVFSKKILVQESNLEKFWRSNQMTKKQWELFYEMSGYEDLIELTIFNHYSKFGYIYNEEKSAHTFLTDKPFKDNEWAYSNWRFSFVFEEENGNFICEMSHRMTNNHIASLNNKNREVDKNIIKKYFVEHL